MYTEMLIEIKNSGVNFNVEAKIEDLNELENKLNFDFPLDFKNFYLKVNGFVDFKGVERHALWNTKRIAEDNTLLDLEYIKFADYMFCLPWIGYSRKDKKIYKGYGYESEFDGEVELIANNFLEFIELIKIDAKLLY